jgi:hypothetical protein
VHLLLKAQLKVFKGGVILFVTSYVSGRRVLDVSNLSVCECDDSRAMWGRCSLQFSVQTVHHEDEVDLKHCNTEHLELESAETFAHIM